MVGPVDKIGSNSHSAYRAISVRLVDADSIEMLSTDEHKPILPIVEREQTKDVAMIWLLIASKCLARSSLAQAQIIWKPFTLRQWCVQEAHCTAQALQAVAFCQDTTMVDIKQVLLRTILRRVAKSLRDVLVLQSFPCSWL